MSNYYYNQPSNPMEELKKFFKNGSVLSVIIIVNLVVWILIQVLKVILFLSGSQDVSLAIGWISHYLAIPAYLPVLTERPWTIITYMFLHLDIWHILFNMLWLYWFGKIFLEYISERKLVAVYLLGGIAGAATYVFAFNVFPVFLPVLPVSYALGASASVMAIVTTIAFYIPAYSIRLLFFGNVRIVYMAIVLFVFDFFMIPSGNAGGHLAHIGGALFGFVYAGILRNSNKDSKQNIKQGFQWFTGFFSGLSRKPGMKKEYNPHHRPVSDDEYNFQKIEKQKKIDEILEKISKGGYDSLTREEKELLFRSSGKR